MEDYLDGHPGPAAASPPEALGPHVEQCRRCGQRWTVAARSRKLLAPLQRSGEPPADPNFYARLRARIEGLEPRWRRAEIRWRHVVLAGVLFAMALGAFVYDMHQVETPNADEAMVLDVPHINPNHPVDSHVRPQLADAMENLMNP
ncbi:MAG: hypothetical protein ACRD04_12645 [Terriglobales bacterium]